jgi:uncharacterized protein
MQLSGTQQINASVHTVWTALNDPAVLVDCLPGCESVTQETPEAFRIVMTAAVGPLKAKFKGTLRITDARPPHSCVMVFEGQGGAMGFGKGSATVNLADEQAESTRLEYNAQAQVGGKLAQVGSRLIDSVAKKMADDFFARFRERLLQGAALFESGTSGPQEQSQVEPTQQEPSMISAIVRTPHSLPEAPRVPTWWLMPAAGFGALLAILAIRLAG